MKVRYNFKAKTGLEVQTRVGKDEGIIIDHSSHHLAVKERSLKIKVKIHQAGCILEIRTLYCVLVIP